MTGTSLFSAVTGVRSTPDTRDGGHFPTTELHLASTGGHTPVRLPLELARLHAGCPSPPGSDSAGRGLGSAFVFGREI